MARETKRFQDRNPVVIGTVGLVALGILVVGGWRAGDLPLVGGGDAYYAEFAESGGSRSTTPYWSRVSEWAK